VAATIRTLTDEEKKVEEEAFRFLEENFDKLAADYERIYGRIIDADRIKELFPMFATTEQTRRRWASAVYAPAARLADHLFHRFLREQISRVAVVLLAGGPGSGKSTFSAQPDIEKILSEAAVTVDGTLSDTERAITFIEAALDAGKEVVVFYVHCNFQRAIEGVIDRALSPISLRVVPMSVVSAKHFGAVQTLKTISRRFGHRADFAIRVAVFQGIGEPFAMGEIEDVLVSETSTVDPLIQKAYSILDDRYEADRVSQSRQNPTERRHLTEDLYQSLRR